jgi:hypothetical protein
MHLRSLARVPVIALTSAAANLTTIAARPIVFGEPLAAGDLALVARMLAFVLVIAPPPQRPVLPAGARDNAAI